MTLLYLIRLGKCTFGGGISKECSGLQNWTCYSSKGVLRPISMQGYKECIWKICVLHWSSEWKILNIGKKNELMELKATYSIRWRLITWTLSKSLNYSALCSRLASLLAYHNHLCMYHLTVCYLSSKQISSSDTTCVNVMWVAENTVDKLWTVDKGWSSSLLWNVSQGLIDSLEGPR
jgi:hypothetical protein